MNITRYRLYRYSLPFKHPLRFKEVTLRIREGLLVQLESECGVAAWGEVAPLPGFSDESLDSAIDQLRRLLPETSSKPIPDEVARLDGAFERWLGAQSLYPSVRHGIETAILALIANAAGKSMARLLAGEPPATFRINGFISGTATEVTELARRMQRDGYRAVKLKVGQVSVGEDIDRTKNVYRELDTRCHLRLDANGAWSIDQAREFFEGIRDFKIEYIEDPVDTLDGIRQLLSESAPPIALDEFLCSLQPDDLTTLGGITAIILKPTLLGGLERSAQFAREARKLKIKSVVSSSFESSLGIAALGPLVTAYGTPGVPVGLDTVGWFDADILATPIAVQGGVMRVEQLARAAQSLDIARLFEVSLD